MIFINGTVGKGGRNQLLDVMTVQTALNNASASKQKLKVDGQYGKKTHEAILRYQLSVFHNPKLCDGLIEPHGATLRSLNRPQEFCFKDVLPGVLAMLSRALGEHDSTLTTSSRTDGTGSTAKLTDADFQSAARALGDKVEVAMIRAFAEAESGGRSGFGTTGFPRIAFEGHIFQQLTDHAFDKSDPQLSYSFKSEGKAGPKWRKNNANDAASVATLKQAMKLDQNAAYQACSWGMFQVMGFNFEACGYSNVDTFVAAMKAGERGQLDAFVGFCKAKSGMVKAIEEKNFRECARLYNGPSFGDYDKRISAAYARLSKKH